MQLSKLQDIFQKSILQNSEALPNNWVSAKGRASPETQLSIYSYAYRSRLEEVLADDFPAMLLAIGDGHFSKLASDYIKAHPSTYFSLRDFGKHMPNFIHNLLQEDKNYQQDQWLYELCLFEWALGQTFDAADTKLLSEQDMANITPESWPDLQFTIHPSVQHLELEWNIPTLWQALTSDTPSEVSAVKETTSAWLFWRENLVTRYRSMHSDEQLALDALISGKHFNEICAVLADVVDDEQVPLRAASYLKIWITQGLISGIKCV